MNKLRENSMFQFHILEVTAEVKEIHHKYYYMQIETMCVSVLIKR